MFGLEGYNKMSDESIEYQVKPEPNLNLEKFKKEADDYLNKLESYKMLDKTMKQYEANLKEFMVKNDMEIYTNDKGRITIDYVKVNCLNRALIDDIRQYYHEQDRIIMRKTLKSIKPKKQ